MQWWMENNDDGLGFLQLQSAGFLGLQLLGLWFVNCGRRRGG